MAETSMLERVTTMITHKGVELTTRLIAFTVSYNYKRLSGIFTLMEDHH